MYKLSMQHSPIIAQANTGGIYGFPMCVRKMLNIQWISVPVQRLCWYSQKCICYDSTCCCLLQILISHFLLQYLHPKIIKIIPTRRLTLKIINIPFIFALFSVFKKVFNFLSFFLFKGGAACHCLINTISKSRRTVS